MLADRIRPEVDAVIEAAHALDEALSKLRTKAAATIWPIESQCGVRAVDVARACVIGRWHRYRVPRPFGPWFDVDDSDPAIVRALVARLLGPETARLLERAIALRLVHPETAEKDIVDLLSSRFTEDMRAAFAGPDDEAPQRYAEQLDRHALEHHEEENQNADDE